MAVVQGAYNVSKFAADRNGEIQRLKAQIDLFWKSEFDLYCRLGLRAGMSLIDCGCGPGYGLAKLRETLPELSLTGIEIDPILADLAREDLADLPNCTIVEQSICEIAFPDGTFDFAVVRLVIEHLSEPLSAIKEVLRVLKPGGVAVFIDNDFDLHEQTFPDSPALGSLYEAYRRARRAEGGNPCIGRELPSLLKRGGFTDVDLQLLAAHSQITGDSAFLRAEGAGIPAQLVNEGYLAPDDLERVAVQWSSMLQAPNHSIFRMLFAGSGKKASPELQRLAKNEQPVANVNDVRLSSQEFERCDQLTGWTREDLRRFIQNTLAAEMDLAVDELACDEPLIHLGIDSIAAVSLCNRIKSSYLVTLPVAEVLCGKSIAGITDRVVQLLATTAGNEKSNNRAISSQPRQ